MTTSPHEARPLRADAERNRQLLLDAASCAFTECGVDVSVAEIARRAGVGQGTVFRRFPTKELLFTAVVERHMLRMIEEATRCLEEPDPWEGLRRLMQGVACGYLSDRALHDAISTQGCTVPEQLAPIKAQFSAAADAVLARAQASGAVRVDIGSFDIFMLVLGASQAAAMPDVASLDVIDRMLALLMDSLRPAQASVLPGSVPEFPVH